MHIDEQFRIKQMLMEIETNSASADQVDVSRIEQIVDAIKSRSATVDELRFAMANRQKIIELRDQCNEMAQEFSRVERLCEDALIPEDTVIDGSVAYQVRPGFSTRYYCLTGHRSAEFCGSEYDPKKTIAYVRIPSRFNQESQSWVKEMELYLGRFETRKAAEDECLSWIKTGSCKTATGVPVEPKDLR